MTGSPLCCTFSASLWSPGCWVEAVYAGGWGLLVSQLTWESERTLTSGPQAPLWNERSVPGSCGWVGGL